MNSRHVTITSNSGVDSLRLPVSNLRQGLRLDDLPDALDGDLSPVAIDVRILSHRRDSRASGRRPLPAPRRSSAE